MTILEEEKHTASASSAGSNKDSHSPINSVSPSSGIQQTSITSVVTSGQQQQGSASTAAQTAVTRITSSSEVNVTKNHLLSNMISNVADRYITPEYLAPLPSSEKNGKSPLQLLAQTCSQIGADPGNTKLSLDKNNTKDNNNKKSSSSPALIVSDNASPGGTQVNHSRPVSFKPYESGSSDRNNKTPSSVISLSPNSNSKHNSSTSPPNSSKSPLTTTSATTAATAKTSTTSEQASATPVIRSGMEVLAGQPKDLMSLYANPAFRPPLGGAAAAAGYHPPSLVPPTSLAASLAAAAAGSLGTSVCRDPYCRDPTCPTAIYNAQLTASLMASGLPPGYAELFNAHKAATAANNPTAGANGAGMFICNWNGREGYCGKRHASAEELLQHLRTHTNLSTSDSAIYSASAAQSNFQRTYGSALSSLSSASRFHPYAAAAAAAAAAAKTSALPPSLSGLGGLPGAPPGLPPGLPPSLYSSAAASSLYASLYGARLAGSLP